MIPKELKGLLPQQQPLQPDEYKEVDVKLNDTELYKKKGEYMLWGYFNNNSFVTYTQASDYYTARLYAQGRQPIDKYRNSLCPENRKTGKRLEYGGYSNISWDILPVLPAKRAWILGEFDKIDYATNVFATDELSKNERNMEKMRFFAEQRDAEYFAQVDEAIGIQAAPRAVPFSPKTVEDLDFMEMAGSFKLGVEVVMEKKLTRSMEISLFKETKKRLFEDAIDLGIMATKTYNDPVSKFPQVRYVDPLNLIVSANRTNNYLNITQAAEVRMMSLTDLKNQGLTDEQLMKCVSVSSGILGNVALNTLPFVNAQYPSWNNWMYQLGEFMVPVLDAECQSLDVEKYEVNVRDGQDKMAVKRKLGVKKLVDSRNRLETKTYKKWYRFKWVPGTDVVWDYGHQYDQVYDEYQNPKSSYNIYRVADKSLIQQCISTADDIQLVVLKLRAAWAMARPSGMDIDIRSISNLDIGTEKMHPFDLISIFTQTGNRLYTSQINPATGAIVTGGTPPITDNKGTSLEEIQKYLFGLNGYYAQLENITSISSAIDGSAPIPGQLTGTTQIAEQGAKNTLRPMLSAYKYIKEETLKSLARRHQLIAKAKMLTGQVADFEDYYLGVCPDITTPTFDINIDTIVDDKMKMNIEAQALESMNAAKQGNPGITLADYFMITRMIEAGQLKLAQIYLAGREAQEKQRVTQEAQQMQMITGQNAQMLEKEKQNTLNLQYENEVNLVKMQEMLKLERELELLLTEYKLKDKYGEFDQKAA